jgi:superfamily II DNA helicase RecQ
MDADELNDTSGMYEYIAWFMQYSFGKKPRPTQKEPIARLLDMVSAESDSYPSTFVLVAPTSRGKSLIRDIVGRILRGVYWTICPLLSLSADQTEKMAQYQKENQDDGIRAIHIDTIKEDADIANVTKKILAMHEDSTRVAALFSSPQDFCLPWVASLFNKCLELKLLRLFCIDEIHIAVQHALTFRSEYKELREPVFDKLRSKREGAHEEELVIPVLLMTATATRAMIMNHYPKISGHNVLEKNISWP